MKLKIRESYDDTFDMDEYDDLNDYCDDFKAELNTYSGHFRDEVSDFLKANGFQFEDSSGLLEDTTQENWFKYYGDAIITVSVWFSVVKTTSIRRSVGKMLYCETNFEYAR